MKDRGAKGFTLVELLIVMVMIGILAAIAIPRFKSVRQKAFQSALKSDMKNLATRQEIYRVSTLSYASSLAVLEVTTSSGVNVSINVGNNTGWAATATHSALATAQCGYYSGDADPTEGSPATTNDSLMCTF